MGLPSGRKWAVANIDLSSPSGFQEVEGVVSPFKYECSFCSWGNTDMYNPNERNSFAGVYNWGGVNANAPYYEGQPYGSTPGAALAADFGPSFDAARCHLGAPWRIPRSYEYKELFDYCDFINAEGDIVTGADRLITMNGIVGIRLRSRLNGNVIFFPCSGFGSLTSWISRGAGGFFWSSSWVSGRNAQRMYFSDSLVSAQAPFARCFGYAVRPVF